MTAIAWRVAVRVAWFVSDAYGRRLRADIEAYDPSADDNTGYRVSHGLWRGAYIRVLLGWPGWPALDRIPGPIQFELILPTSTAVPPCSGIGIGLIPLVRLKL